MIWIIATVALIILIVWRFYIKPYSYWKNMGVPQTRPWIIFGDAWPTLLRIKDLREWMTGLYNLHPESKFVGFYSFYFRALMLREPEIIKQIAVKDFDYFTDHKSLSIPEEVDPMWSRNLFSLKGQRWRDMRSLLSGAFTSSKMRIMYALISEESEKFVKYFLKKDEAFIDIELKDAFTRFTTDVIAYTSFGIKVDSLETPDNEFFLMGKEVSHFSGLKVLFKFIGGMAFPWLLRLLDIGFLSKRSSTFFRTIIEETLKAREEKGIVRPDMINLLLEVKREFNKPEETDIPDAGFAVVKESTELVKPQKKQIQITNLDIASQAVIFFLAGFDSVSSAMCYTCYELATNHHTQDKLRKEIKHTWKETDGKPSYEDILGMKYLDMVVTEALRMWPVAPAADRVCVKPYTMEPKSPTDPTVFFQKGDNIWIPIFNIHHDPRYYQDPEKFIPERFSVENRGKIIPYTYMPFGVGPRACIGSRFALLEIKSVLFHLLNYFEIVPTEKTTIPLKLNKAAINLAPEGGFPFGLKRVLS